LVIDHGHCVLPTPSGTAPRLSRGNVVAKAGAVSVIAGKPRNLCKFESFKRYCPNN